MKPACGYQIANGLFWLTITLALVVVRQNPVATKLRLVAIRWHRLTISLLLADNQYINLSTMSLLDNRR